VVVEKALAGGLDPVLTTQTGGLLEATGGHCVEIEPSSPQSITQQLDWVCNRGMDEAAKCAMAEAARKHALGFDRAKVLRELMSLVEGQQDDQGEEGEGKGGNETDQNL
jgi:glycogen(starch) synthase